MDFNGEELDISREIVILLAVLIKTIGFQWEDGDWTGTKLCFSLETK